SREGKQGYCVWYNYLRNRAGGERIRAGVLAGIIQDCSERDMVGTLSRSDARLYGSRNREAKARKGSTMHAMQSGLHGGYKDSFKVAQRATDSRRVPR